MSTEGRRRASTTYISGPRPRFNALEPFIIRYLEYLVDKRIAPIAPAVGASKQRKREAPRGRIVAPQALTDVESLMGEALTGAIC